MALKRPDAAAKAKHREGSDAQAAADKALAKGQINHRDLNALILSDLAIPGGPSEKY